MIAVETVQIPLSRGLFATIDASDHERVAPYKWHATTPKRHKIYAATHIGGLFVRMHVFIMQPEPGFLVDHENGDGLLNTRRNLRIATNAQNQHNSVSRRGSSRFKGVSFCKLTGRWRVNISANCKAYDLGRFDSEIDAALAWNEAARQLHGTFARLNVIPAPTPNA